MEGTTRLSQAVFFIVVATIGVTGGVYSACIDRDAAGFLHDDGVYLVTASAIAAGDGPRLTHLPGAPYEVRYPYLYPLMLAVGWRMEGGFPDNVEWLAAASAMCALVFLSLFFRYLISVKGADPSRAWVVMILAATTYQFVVYATAIMAEMLYLFLSILVIWHAERCLVTPTWRTVLVNALLVTLAFHTRTAGVALIAAVVVYLASARAWRHAALYAGVAFALTMLPWYLWTRAHATPIADGADYVLASPYGGYLFDLGLRADTDGYTGFAAAWNGTSALIGGIAAGLFPIVPHLPDIAGGIFAAPPWPAIAAAAGWLVGLAIIVLLAVSGIAAVRRGKSWSVPALYVTATLALIVAWNHESAVGRLLVPVVPWLWYYLFRALDGAPAWSRVIRRIAGAIGGQRGAPQVQAAPARPAAPGARGSLVATCIVLVLAIPPSVLGIAAIAKVRRHTVMAQMRAKDGAWSEYDAAFRHIREALPADATIAAESDPAFHLYTERRTFHLHYNGTRLAAGAAAGEVHDDVLAALARYGVGYLAIEPEDFFVAGAPVPNQLAAALVDQHPARFRLCYSSPRGMIQLYEVLPAVAGPAPTPR